ncbi:integral membrane protein GPR155-like isoform X2 [Amphibalanus amphitrite]|uniref:integral membrane protein GPR155-like isoform X1 n=1 Tax=Amphibalanus amphitrite TaxID=1232801 RepID=UPI001C90A0F5|nr:integral membrane protein GPR155-like isoform X1 [Amphibalanus amphitrite]XP_043238168.1 integral membrane protein GPR155-like isoform X2 [Amphibalanus amphitrite]
MQVPGFLVTVLVLGGLLWTSYFHVLWYGSRLEYVGGYSCTDQVIHYGEFEITDLCSNRETDNKINVTERDGNTQGASNSSGSGPALGSTPDSGELEEPTSTLERLAPAIAECFAVILCGYLAGRMGLIRPDEISGLNKFVGNFVLPALIFLSLANLNFGDVNWGFLVILYGAKALVFVLVVLVTAVASYPTNVGRAGLYGIFCTQSNDFALGYPLVQALYAKTHPDYASYLYLAAPSSLMLLNPIGFLLLELQRARSAAKVSSSWFETGQRVLTGIGTNPVVFMTFLGIVANGVFDHCLPNILEGILKVLGQAFSASALFMLGIQMVGKVKSMKGSTLLVPLILISVKCFFLPLIVRGLLVHFPPPGENIRDFQDYGFLIGTFPTAPGVFVFAKLYNIDVDMLSSALVACTFLAMPFMLLSARMASIGQVNVAAYVSSLRRFVLHMTSVGACTLACVVLVLLITRKHRRVPYQTTVHLLAAQLLAAVGALLWYSLEDDVPWQLYLKYTVFTLGQFAGRVWAALLAVTLTLVSRYTVGVVQRLRTASLLIGWGVPALLTIGVFAGSEYEGYAMANQTTSTNFSVVPVYVRTNPNMGFGVGQIHTNFAVQFVCLIVVVVNLMLHNRYKNEYVTYVSLEETAETAETAAGGRPAPPPSVRSGSCRSRLSVTSQVSTTTSLGTSVAAGGGETVAPAPAPAPAGGAAPAAAGAATGAAPARRPPPRPLLKTRSQLQVEQAFLNEAQRKASAPELTTGRDLPPKPMLATRTQSVPSKMTKRKISAREQLTLSFSVKPTSLGSNWKLDDRSTPPPPATAEVKELSFSVKKLKKRDSELSAGFVIQCDATGCQLRKKISPSVTQPSAADDDAVSSVFGAGSSVMSPSCEDTISVASGETDLSAFSSVSHSTAASFATRPPSAACSLYNPDTRAVDSDALRLDSAKLPTESSSVIRDRDEEFHTLRHTLLLVSLAWSMVVSMFLCGCSLPVQREGKMGGVYIQLTFIDTIINFGQGILAFFVLGLDPEALLMPLRKRWMSLRYGSSCLSGHWWRRSSPSSGQEAELVCQKFIDFYLDQCKQELVRDRRVQQKLYHDVFMGTELVDWLLVQGLAGSRRAAVRYGRHLLDGGIIEHEQRRYAFHDRPFWYRLAAPFGEDGSLQAEAKISSGSAHRARPAATIVNVD